MGNQDFDGWGFGPLLEYQGSKGSITIKTGYKHTTTHKGSVYTGIEFYTSF